MQWEQPVEPGAVCPTAALSLSALFSSYQRAGRGWMKLLYCHQCSTELLYARCAAQIGLPAAVLCRGFFNKPRLTRQRHQNPADSQSLACIYRAEPRLRSSGSLSPFTGRRALSHSGDKVPIAGPVCVCLFLSGAASCSLCRLLMTRASERELLWSLYWFSFFLSFSFFSTNLKRLWCGQLK